MDVVTIIAGVDRAPLLPVPLNRGEHGVVGASVPVDDLHLGAYALTAARIFTGACATILSRLLYFGLALILVDWRSTSSDGRPATSHLAPPRGRGSPSGARFGAGQRQRLS